MQWTGNDFAYTVYRKLSVVQDSNKERFALTCKQFQRKETSNWNRVSPLYESLLILIDIWRRLSGRPFVGKQSGNTKAQENKKFMPSPLQKIGNGFCLAEVYFFC